MNKFVHHILTYVLSALLISCGAEGNDMVKGTSTTEIPFTDSTLALVEHLPSTHRFENIASYLNWYLSPKSGNQVTRVQGECLYEMTYKPALILAFDGLTPGAKVDNALIDQTNNMVKDSGNLVFHLKISGNIEHATFRTEKNTATYFGYEAEKDFSLIVGKDTLQPIMMHYENTYPQLPYLSVLLTFNRKHTDNPIQKIVFSGSLHGNVEWPFYEQTLFYQPTFTKINELWR